MLWPFDQPSDQKTHLERAPPPSQIVPEGCCWPKTTTQTLENITSAWLCCWALYSIVHIHCGRHRGPSLHEEDTSSADWDQEYNDTTWWLCLWNLNMSDSRCPSYSEFKRWTLNIYEYLTQELETKQQKSVHGVRENQLTTQHRTELGNQVSSYRTLLLSAWPRPSCHSLSLSLTVFEAPRHIGLTGVSSVSKKWRWYRL